MIADISQSLRALLSQPELQPAAGAGHVDIVFDRPGEAFAPSQDTIDLFLYDIRENRDLTPPPSGGRHVALACLYLVTAWPTGGGELALREHDLLGHVLGVLARNPAIPARFLQGALAGQTPPRLLLLHPEAMQSTAEFWTALGGKLRPSLSLTVTLSLPVEAADG
jgi:hypothetical protein